MNANGRHIASTNDEDEFAIHSVYLPRVLGAIDALWGVLIDIESLGALDRSTIDGLTAPRWLREWIADPTSQIDLDAAYARGAC
jgi:hypothetical protein